MAILFRCPYCDYTGSDSVYHVRDNHPQMVDDFNQMLVQKYRAEKQLAEKAVADVSGAVKQQRPDVGGSEFIDDIDRRFNYHRPSSQQVIDSHTAIRSACKEAAKTILSNVPNCRERSLAITKLEEAMMWGNAAIARNCNNDIEIEGT